MKFIPTKLSLQHFWLDFLKKEHLSKEIHLAFKIYPKGTLTKGIQLKKGTLKISPNRNSKQHHTTFSISFNQCSYERFEPGMVETCLIHFKNTFEILYIVELNTASMSASVFYACNL